MLLITAFKEKMTDGILCHDVWFIFYLQEILYQGFVNKKKPTFL